MSVPHRSTMHPTHWLISTQVATITKLLSYLIRPKSGFGTFQGVHVDLSPCFPSPVHSDLPTQHRQFFALSTSTTEPIRSILSRSCCDHLGSQSRPSAVASDLCGNQPVCRVHKSFLGDNAAVLAPSTGEEPTSPRHRACRVDGVEVDAAIQDERAVNLSSTQVVNQKNVLWDHLSCRDLCGNQNFTARSC